VDSALLTDKKIASNLKETFEGRWPQVYNEELRCAFRSESNLPATPLLANLKEKVEPLYGSIPTDWF
jgi:hypothetical protein